MTYRAIDARHRRVLAAALALLTLTAVPALAADYPDHPITGIVPFTTGGGSDLMARLAANQLVNELGKPVIVENKPGAGGNIGIGLVSQSKADGYTLLFCSTAMTQNPALYKNLGWNPDELEAVAQVGAADQVMVVNIARFPKGNLQDFIAFLKQNPGKLNFAAQDSGLVANLFRTASGTQFEIINYAGGGEAALSVMNGETDSQTMVYLSAQGGIKAGKTRALAVTGPKRLPQLPDVPTTTEAGLPNYMPHSYFGVFVRKGTPRAIINALNAALNKIGDTPDLVGKMAGFGYTPIKDTPEEFDRFFRSDIARWKKVVAESGIKTLD